jgi:outer membrane protein, multidrug efflux system
LTKLILNKIASIVSKQAQCDSEFKAIVALTGYEHQALESKIKSYHSQIENKESIAIPTAIPADLITQRPDIYNAYRNVEAKALDVGVAKGESYPRVSFSGNILANKLSTGSISTTGTTWSIGPLNITPPIFDAGVRKANEELSMAAYENAKIEFASTLRTAVKEIETSYIKLNASNDKLVLNALSTDGFQKSLEASTTRYQAGLSNLYELEDSRRSYLNSLQSTIINQSDRVNSWIDLYKAMGGEFYKEIK